MAIVEDLIDKGKEGTLSFGNYLLSTKTKKADFMFENDSYKVKTFKEITKLEKNGMFVYESVPGSAVTNFKNTGEEASFVLESFEDVSITLELEPDSEFEVTIAGEAAGKMKTNFAGKLNISVELDEGEEKEVIITKC
ncbi:MAG: endosialidase [Lachnoclostridium sp.]|nr:endosialidase [Lachnoclostridium sp.]